ncbi:MAG: hypothetical protein NT013_08065 [Planctomycetia bacterium]|nr:hypothetical protein [Planctomycetia bacterium]
MPRSLWPNPVLVFRIADKLTSTGATVRSVFAGIEAMPDGSFQALLDWQLLARLNGLLSRRPLSRTERRELRRAGTADRRDSDLLRRLSRRKRTSPASGHGLQRRNGGTGRVGKP